MEALSSSPEGRAAGLNRKLLAGALTRVLRVVSSMVFRFQWSKYVERMTSPLSSVHTDSSSPGFAVDYTLPVVDDVDVLELTTTVLELTTTIKQ